MIRRFALATALGAALVVAAPATQAQAIAHCQTNQICTTSYYSDALFTNLVGQSVVNPCVTPTQSSSWGTQARFIRVTTVFC